MTYSRDFRRELFQCGNIFEHYNCELCDYKTNLFITLNDHTRNYCKSDHAYSKSTYSEIRCYTCKNCDFTSYSLLVLFAHEKCCASKGFCDLLRQKLLHDIASQDKREYVHDQCAYRRKEKFLAKEIQISQQPDDETNLFQCNQCNTILKTKAILGRHIKLQHPSEERKRHNCSQCTFTTFYKHNLQHHTITQHEPEKIKWYECDKCNYKAKIKGHLNQHKKYRHPSGNLLQFKCSLCSFKTPYKWDFRRHQLLHNGKTKTKFRKLRCYRCNYETTAEEEYKLHVKLKHMQCNQCTFNTLYNRALERHIRICHADPKRNK